MELLEKLAYNEIEVIEAVGGTVKLVTAFNRLFQFNLTLILDTASSACIILKLFVGRPSQTNCVVPKYRALNKTPSISTSGSSIPK